MSLNSTFSMTAFPPMLYAAGTYTSGPIAPAGEAEFVAFFVDVSAGAGTTFALAVTLQTSPDQTTWTSIARSAITPIATATGSAFGFSQTPDEYAQLVAVVSGTGTPTMTFMVKAVLL